MPFDHSVHEELGATGVYQGSCVAGALAPQRGQLIAQGQVLLYPERDADAHRQLVACLQFFVGVEERVTGAKDRLLHCGEAERPGH